MCFVLVYVGDKILVSALVRLGEECFSSPSRAKVLSVE